MKAEKVAEIAGFGESRILAFKALSCVECEPDLLLTIRSTLDEKVISESYPGKTTNLETITGIAETEPFAEVRAFYGTCVAGSSTEVFLVDSVFPRADRGTRRTIESDEHGLKASRAEVPVAELRTFKAPSGCHELPGVDREIEE
jgi:hypothetical protein